MGHPNVTWRIILYDYLILIYHWTTTRLYFRNIFEVTSAYYISNGFTKSACVSFRDSSINYSLVCGLPIHTRRSAKAEGPREHTVSWNRVKCCTKCSTDCIRKGMQPVNDLQDHSSSLPLLRFDRPYTISY